jgi:5-methyltetrahydropteroyltriglutamate--homocysteine methyltransferase
MGAHPPFRAEHIGSLLRPAALLDLRRKSSRGEIDGSELTRAEDRAIEQAVALQRRLGLRLATDGELRRRSYHSYFYAQLGDVDEFWDDTVAAYRSELQALAAAGCNYVQIDETAFAKFADPAVQAALAARGDDWRALIDRYIEVTNRVLRGIDGMRVGMHLCRGNRGGHWHAEGGYDTVADKLFNQLDITFFFLEYDSSRAGDFSPLRLVPAHKGIVLGLVSTKTPVLEDKAELRRRVEEASRYVDLDRLAVSPQCGFASAAEGNPITEADQEAKLRLVVELAQEIWGEA